MKQLNTETMKFVSRGGLKLQSALENFKVDVSGKVVLDVGSSTGGFVDCLLQNGALRVYSVDTAYGELAWKLRNDPRVVVMERTNILHLESLPSVILGSDSDSRIQKRSWTSQDDTEDKVDLITIDASWTKLELILPVVQKFLKPGAKIVALLKPHYQANKRDLLKGVLPKEIAEQVKAEVIERVEDLGFRVQDVIESPILGGGGNTEYLLKISPS